MKLNSLAKFSLLSISILLMSHLAISPVIPNLYRLYNAQNPNIGLASVESLATIPAMMITVFVLLSNFIIKGIGKKTLENLLNYFGSYANIQDATLQELKKVVNEKVAIQIFNMTKKV